MLLAADPGAIEATRGQAIELVAKSWRQTISHERHHAVITFDDGRLEIPAGGLPWQGPSYVNLVVCASTRRPSPATCSWSARTRRRRSWPGHGRDPHRPLPPRERKGPEARGQVGLHLQGIALTKQRTVVLAHRLSGLAKGERLLVKARLVTDATGLPAPARISTRLFLADRSRPGRARRSRRRLSMSWKGQLSKHTGFNCLPAEGPQPSRKYGVAKVAKAPGADLYVNLVAVSAPPSGARAHVISCASTRAAQGSRSPAFRPE